MDAIFPLDRDSFAADFLKSLHRDTASTLDPDLSSANNKQSALLGVYTYYGKDWSAENTFGPTLGFCTNRYNLPFIDDRANQQTEVFYASWVSVRYPDFGKAVMSHEMGHIVDSFLRGGDASHSSFQNFIKAQNCLAAKHPEADPKQSVTYAVNTKGPTGETTKNTLQMAQYNAEDFADQISAIVFPDINLACGLAFGGEPDSNQSIVNSSAADTHSSAFFRSLSINGAANGSLPKVCQDALASAGVKTDFSSCIESTNKMDH